MRASWLDVPITIWLIARLHVTSVTEVSPTLMVFSFSNEVVSKKCK
jgi:hypothetical protein